MNTPTNPDFTTADLIDIAPDTPSCELPFFSYGCRRHFCGKARTVKCFQDNGLVKQILNTPGNGNVLVVDGAGSRFSALVGDMLAEAGRKNGWAGIVINGVIRDSAAINTMDFGIKALGTNPKKSAKDAVGVLDGNVHFGNVTFRSGDWVYCDEDGVLVSAEPIHASTNQS
ncbi:ribonuclease E activity regulator RraA [Stenoxybacter acetivorans]|uniref:ribonuclease E activity regulator RraA n=1 Tax=Stenoxybacter acetivorans TaxID=422441 RepID=UPI00056D2414|nr:ribonuclease E activity regulator RraA [Stenoxybacter acetivorans]